MADLKPRQAVLAMAPYHPPTGDRINKLRLDFNENTVGCSPLVIEALRNFLSPEALAVYPDYDRVKQTLARFFDVTPDELLLTNGTDEAIQVLINTYIDDDAEVITLRPSYAMYRFYAELAGARLVEIAYETPGLAFPLEALLHAITPRTRAVLISNPNNPTGTATGILEIELILARAKNAIVLVDEAYFEFCGTTALDRIRTHPNLFVSRTFSKVYGMATMRIGCLFSHAANVAFLRKAQSPYSVNTLAAIAAEAAVKDSQFVADYVAEALAARQMLCAGLDRLGIAHAPSSANFVLGYFGDRALEVRDRLRDQAILVRDRSYEIPGGVRITTGTRQQIGRVLEELGQILAMKDLIVFDMDGVLVDVTASYRATIQATVKLFTGYDVSGSEIQDWKNRGGWNDDWQLSHAIIREHGFDPDFQTVVDRFQEIFLGDGANGLILREQWLAADGLFNRLADGHRLGVCTGRYRWEADLTLKRFAPSVFDPVIGIDDVQRGKPDPEGLLKICGTVEHGRCWYVGDTVDDARASKAASIPFVGIAAPGNPRYDELVRLLREEGAVAVLDDINGLEAAIAQNR